MLEATLSAGKKSSDPGPTPLLGYDFSRKKSTGLINTTTTAADADVVAYGDKAAGYASGLRNNNKLINISPMTSMNLGLDDFTIEFWAWLSPGPVGYTTFFQVTYDGGKTFPIRIGDDGFVNRLQFAFFAAVLGYNKSSGINRNAMQSAWHHVALVRDSGRARFYYDGVQLNLASGTSQSYTDKDADASIFSLRDVTAFTFGGGAYEVYLPEFAIWQGVKYKGNFTPKKGSLVL